MEVYKNVFGNYYISNFGNIKRGDKIINGSITNRGYKYFQTQDNKKRTNHLLHHLVIKHFLGDRPIDMVIDHIDRDKLNNHIDNLRYVPQSENMKNTHIYRSDILEVDKRLRRNILSKERDRRNGRFKGIKRVKGSGSLLLRPNSTWRAIIIIDKVKHDKTFKTKEEGEEFLVQFNK